MSESETNILRATFLECCENGMSRALRYSHWLVLISVIDKRRRTPAEKKKNDLFITAIITIQFTGGGSILCSYALIRVL